MTKENEDTGVTDFCAMQRSTDGHQVLVMAYEDEDGDGLLITTIINGVVIRLSMTPLHADLVASALKTFGTNEADALRARMKTMKDTDLLAGGIMQ